MDCHVGCLEKQPKKGLGYEIDREALCLLPASIARAAAQEMVTQTCQLRDNGPSER